jgi:hypothetical protein
MYLLGVVLGVMDAQHRLPYPLKDNISHMMQLGYTDTRMLVDGVRRDGDAPQGDYADLLALPCATVPPDVFSPAARVSGPEPGPGSSVASA